MKSVLSKPLPTRPSDPVPSGTVHSEPVPSGAVPLRGAPFPSVVTVATEVDGLLSVLVPLALGASAGTALVVDLDPEGLPLPGAGSLADLVRRGPTVRELRPARAGMAVLANGGIGPDDAAEVVAALGRGWPRMIVRRSPSASVDLRVVPVLPVPISPVPVPPVWSTDDRRPLGGRIVYQQTGLGGRVPDGAYAVRPPSARDVRALMAGRHPGRSRWLREWSRLWVTP